MAPIRRYLRISKYSVLECRIYLDNPSDTRWLLNPRDPVLARVFTAIRPLVLPKLREENERVMARKKGRPVKDVIVEDEFEVAVFLRESRTRHSLLTRHKTFEGGDNNNKGLKKDVQIGEATPTNSQRDATSGILVESDSESDLDLRTIPQATTDTGSDKRQREESERPIDSQDSQRPSKRSKTGEQSLQNLDDEADEETKLRFRTNYESFNICGWVLCLLVTRRGERSKTIAVSSEPARQVLMEEWISTQAQADVDDD